MENATFTPLFNTLETTDDKHENSSGQTANNSTQIFDSRLNKRASVKAKYSPIYAMLADLNSPLQKNYWNAYHCNQILIQSGQKVEARWCGERCCNLCSRIRTAQLINFYAEPISQFTDAQFVTLTVRNCEKQDLLATLDKMNQDIRKILKNMHKSKTRNTGLDYAGIRKLEVTYNRYENTYHPHFHFIVDSAPTAQAIKDAWLRLNPSSDAKAQDTRQAYNPKELFKYATKAVYSDKKGKNYVHIEALDWIYQSLRGKRLIQSFGALKKAENVLNDELQITELTGQIYSIPEGERIIRFFQEIENYVSDDGELITNNPLKKYKIDFI